MSADSSKKSDAVREEFAVAIRCKCGQAGFATWKENALSPPGPPATLLAVSSGFYERIQKKNYARSEIACAVCDAAVRD